MRYSGLALSEVSPIPLSHDSISCWLSDNHFRPREIWSLVNQYIRASEPCLLIANDTVLSKTHSQKIELVNYEYSGNAHDVIAGIGLINMLWHELDSEESVPIDYHIDYVTTNRENPTREQVKHITDARWSVEVYPSRSQANMRDRTLSGMHRLGAEKLYFSCHCGLARTT